MKKFLSCFSLVLCLMIGVLCFSACGTKSKWVCPEFSFLNESLRIEHITNMEEDFEFPIEGLKLDHSNFEQNFLEYGWVIYKDDEVVGWIETNGGYSSNKNNYNYGFSAQKTNGTYRFDDQYFCLVLKDTDVSIFDNLEILSNYGVISKQEGIATFSATERYHSYDEVNNVSVPLAGAENFVCCFYNINFDGVNPKNVDNIKITLELK